MTSLTTAKCARSVSEILILTAFFRLPPAALCYRAQVLKGLNRLFCYIFGHQLGRTRYKRDLAG